MASNNGGPWGGGRNNGGGDNEGGDDRGNQGGNRGPSRGNQPPQIPEIDEIMKKGRDQMRVLMGGRGGGNS
jgi:membrane protease subunit HflK